MSSGAGGTPSSRYDVTVDGVGVPAEPDRVVNVHFDERWVWSFRTSRVDGERSAGRLSVAWPHGLVPYLHGTAEISLAEHGRGTLFSTEMVFPGGAGRVAIVDEQGRDLVIGTGDRTMVAFGDDTESAAPLLAAALDVLEVLRSCGIEGFLAFGTLLGAIREGTFIGHDNDVDLGYVSDRADVVDVIRESLRIQRALVRAGMRVERYSGAGLKVWITDRAGVARGLDIFGGFWDGPRLVLLGELRLPFARDLVHPLTTAELAGVEFPVPARADKMLEAMYGPEWRVPDPTFEFDAGADGRIQLGRWFRGIRFQRNEWDRFHAPLAAKAAPDRPHALAEAVSVAEPGATVVDIGCGRGRDVAWLATQGHRAIGLDYSEPGLRQLAEEAAASGASASYHVMNLLELPHVVGWGARLARLDGPRVLMARHLVNSTDRRGRDGLWRLASMALRGGGRMYLEFLAAEEPRPARPEALIGVAVPVDIVAEASRYGARLVDTTWIDTDRSELPRPLPKWESMPRTCRMTLEWK